MLTLAEAHKQLKAAVCPEDIFGKASSIADLKKSFRDLAKVVHPDHKSGTDLNRATEAFKLLEELRRSAEQKMAAGVYGNRLALPKAVKVTTKKAEYSLYARLDGGDICVPYLATDKDKEEVVVKVPRSPGNNDLMENEQATLTYLWEEAPTKSLKAMVHLLRLKDSFMLSQGAVRKRCNVFNRKQGYVSLREVMAAYPHGIDIRDSAWMFNRLLGALLITSQSRVVHGAVLPQHFLIHPEKHNGVLIDWCYSVRRGEKLKAIVKRYEDWYPKEALEKKEVDHTMDLYMAAKLMLALTATDRGTPAMGMPRNIQGLLKTCVLAKRSRPDDVYEFFKEFNAELKLAIGERKYRRFAMPT